MPRIFRCTSFFFRCGLMNRRNLWKEQRYRLCWIKNIPCSCAFFSLNIIVASKPLLYCMCKLVIHSNLFSIYYGLKRNCSFTDCLSHQPSLYDHILGISNPHPQKWLHKMRIKNCLRDGFLRKLLVKELTESKYIILQNIILHTKSNTLKLTTFFLLQKIPLNPSFVVKYVRYFKFRQS